MLTKFVQAFRQKNNQQVTAIIFLLFILIGTVTWLLIKPYANRPPCAVCGRFDTQPVKTLWQYKFQVVPYVIDKDLWYCRRHIKTAPELVTKLPASKDTVAQRYRIVLITGLFSLLSLFFVIILLEMQFTWLFLHPLLMFGSFLLFGVTSNITVTVFIVSTVAIAVAIYFIWNHWYFKRQGR